MPEHCQGVHIPDACRWVDVATACSAVLLPMGANPVNDRVLNQLVWAQSNGKDTAQAVGNFRCSVITYLICTDLAAKLRLAWQLSS